MIPKKLHALWLQGRDQAPDLVRICLDRWEELNPDHRLHLLTEADVGPLLATAGIAAQKIAPQALSDIVRSILLAREGGIWIDATLLPVRPLDEWLPPLSAGGFCAFERPGPDRHLSSWFLASSANNPVMRLWLREVLRFWRRKRRLVDSVRPGDYQARTAIGRMILRPRPQPDDLIASVRPVFADRSRVYPYFWFHYLFDHLLHTEPTVAEAWAHAGKLQADDGHAVQYLYRDVEKPTDAEILTALRRAPVQKLNWREPFSPQLFELARRAAG